MLADINLLSIYLILFSFTWFRLVLIKHVT